MEETSQSTEPQIEVAHHHSKKNNTTVIMALIVFAVVVLAGVGYEMMKKESKPAPISEPAVATPMATTAPQQTSNNFKDGTYTEEGQYETHVGTKKIKVQLTLKNNIITDSTVTGEADDKMSIRYQDMFISGYKEFVTGKNISEVHLSKVSGSSLTPNGFNDALQKIQTDAKS